jgi:hypothetical protein
VKEEDDAHVDLSTANVMEVEEPIIGRTRKNPFLPQSQSSIANGINSIASLSKVKQSIQQQQEKLSNNNGKKTQQASDNNNSGQATTSAHRDFGDSSDSSDDSELEHEASASDEESIDEEEEEMELELEPKAQQVWIDCHCAHLFLLFCIVLSSISFFTYFIRLSFFLFWYNVCY